MKQNYAMCTDEGNEAVYKSVKMIQYGIQSKNISTRKKAFIVLTGDMQNIFCNNHKEIMDSNVRSTIAETLNVSFLRQGWLATDLSEIAFNFIGKPYLYER